jgi:hypothetical protein
MRNLVTLKTSFYFYALLKKDMATDYITSSDYINELTFAYVETYSFRRGEAYDALEAEFNQLQTRKRQDEELNPDESERYSALEDLFWRKPFIIDKNGQFHPYSIKTNTFQHDHPMVDRIKVSLRTEIVQSLAMLCDHIYRDAFVFYNSNHEVVSTLSICLSCFDMRSSTQPRIKADYKTFDYLKRLFLEIGHNVENPSYSVIEDIEKQMEKVKNRKRK